MLSTIVHKWLKTTIGNNEICYILAYRHIIIIINNMSHFFFINLIILLYIIVKPCFIDSIHAQQYYIRAHVTFRHFANSLFDLTINFIYTTNSNDIILSKELQLREFLEHAVLLLDYDVELS